MSIDIEINHPTQLPAALRSLGLGGPRHAIIVVGGAASLVDYDGLLPLFRDGIAGAARRVGAAIIDGGTDVGVMRLMGLGREAGADEFPLIGVAAAGTVKAPGAPRLEPHHTHHLLVPGSHWGDESPWLSRVASQLSRGRQSVTVLVNGGETSRRDVGESLAAGRPVVVIGETGGLAEELARSPRQGGAGFVTEGKGRFVMVPDPRDTRQVAWLLTDILTRRWLP